MKDIKLTIEEIKKIFDNIKVEGFAINDDCIIEPCTIGLYDSDISDRFFREIIYPLLLQKVLEGLDEAYTCNEIEYRVLYNHIDKEYIVDYRGTGNLLGVNGFSIGKGGHDQAKTQAIKYILDKLK